MVAPSASKPVTEPEEGSDFRKAPADTNRMPGSAASMKVLERSRTTPSASSAPTPTRPSTSKSAIQSLQPILDSTSTSAIQPTDIQLLTTSILSNQQRARLVLSHQERLIHTNPSLSQLKESLRILSSSSWGQVLEERHLAGHCAYPPCTNSAPTTGRGGEGRFRISLGAKSVKALEDVDLGEAGNTWDDVRGVFCGKACYARSEWVLRWVLSDGLVREEGTGGGGGKWEKMTSRGEVELLEDIEAENGGSFGEAMLDGMRVEAETARGASTAVPTPARGKDVSNLMGELTIVERPKGTSAPAAAAAASVDVPNNLGARFGPSTTTIPTSITTADDDEDDDPMDAQTR
ncbi:Protein of unknown function DUF408 [Kalmanozyma brasiliensis GHG001]|uniref:Protein of unknown function DUF408 n=1 Tax=Kalmanozyma brasiliensis (strain GHG001) TaxID=1365824 RepID=UPI0028681D47|nr:Protein of unknown function DUF408 [Kalmanozyma brasiliensis GHG001]EST05240.2 Protein of unknown function DUF408 [Kalmanozyma brasiliensis GHG001]